MENVKDIMYCGLQVAPCSDRPNGRPDRVWHGPGTIVDGIPTVQAANLLRHPTEWCDVTGLSPEDRVTKAQAVMAESKETRRALQNPPDSDNRGLGGVSDDELLAELQRRQEAADQIDAGQQINAPTQAPVDDADAPADKGEAKNLILEAIEAVGARAEAGEEDLLDDEGMPTLVAVQEQAGFSISEDELRDALGLAA